MCASNSAWKWLAGSGVAVVILLACWIGLSPSESDSTGLSTTSMPQVVERSKSGDRGPASSGPGDQIDVYSPEGKTSGAKGVHPFSNVPMSRDGLPLEEDPFLAESREEQQWLDRNGYPNAEQWVMYSRASDPLLAAAADAGDPVAGSMLQARALAKGDPHARDKLLASAANGSIFSLNLLAAYSASRPEDGLEIAYAFSKVAELRGDYRAALARDFIFPRQLTFDERLLGDREALSILNELQRINPLLKRTDPRPVGP